MADNLPSRTKLELLAEWFETGKIPGAAKAIAHLVGSTADSLSALIGVGKAKGDQWQQRIRDDTSARSLITNAIAHAAAERGACDPDLVGRAIEHWVGEHIGYQANREAIAAAAIEHLSEGDRPDETTPPPEDDWLNLFSSYAEKASSDNLQVMWSKILSGEIRKPGTFSLGTLHFISILDPVIAADFTFIADYVFEGFVLYDQANNAQIFQRVQHLIDIRLLGNPVSRRLLFTNKQSYIGNKYYIMQFNGMTDGERKFNVYPLTKIGHEIYSIISTKDNFDIVLNFSKTMITHGHSYKCEIYRQKATIDGTVNESPLKIIEMKVDERGNRAGLHVS